METVTAKMHRVHISKVGEAVIYRGSGIPYTADDENEHGLGSYMRLGRRGFVYAKVGTGGVEPDIGAKTTLAQKIGGSALQTAAVAGDMALKITSTVSITEDELEGGEVVVFVSGGGKSFTRGIISNNGMTGTDTLTLQLDSPIPIDVQISGSGAEVIASPYSSVIKTGSLEWNMVMGIPIIKAVEGKYVWLQVSGVCWVIPYGTVGDAVNEQLVVFAGDGTLRMAKEASYESCQIAGVVICPAVGGTGQGAPFIMLDIAH